MSVSELMVTASQRHVLPLQGRPYQEDQVTGLLTIEFLFKDVGLSWEDKDLLPGVYRYTSVHTEQGKVFFHPRSFEAKENQNLAGKSVVNKKTVYSRQASQVPGIVLTVSFSSSVEAFVWYFLNFACHVPHL